MRLVITVAVAVILLTSCGQSVMTSDHAVLPSDTVVPPASESPMSGASAGSPVPETTSTPLAPLACKDWVIGINDYVGGAGGGVTDIVEATRTTQAVNHEADDQVQKIGDTTQIVREGEVVYVGEWHRAEDATWLLDQYKACRMAIPQRPEE
jgi:hypothetical protein